MKAISQTAAFIIPQRNLLQCPQCQLFIRPVMASMVVGSANSNYAAIVPVMTYSCECGFGGAIPQTPEGIPVFNHR